MKKTVVGVMAAGLLIAGCQTTDPYTGQPKTSNTAKGVIGGALAGAVIGAVTNTSSGEQAAKNALLGAGIGALAGGAVGAYMDRQEAEIRQQLAGTGVSVIRQGDNIQLVMPSNVTFATGSSSLNPQFFNVLGGVSTVLQKYNQTVLTVSGHTDSVGDEGYNMQLSVDRASSVAQYLIGQQIMAQRLVVRGYGETLPVASNETNAGKAQNRRVELQIAPLTA
ncbi:MAG: OmpA family protein [Pseudomonadota bacterium]